MVQSGHEFHYRFSQIPYMVMYVCALKGVVVEYNMNTITSKLSLCKGLNNDLGKWDMVIQCLVSSIMKPLQGSTE